MNSVVNQIDEATLKYLCQLTPKALLRRGCRICYGIYCRDKPYGKRIRLLTDFPTGKGNICKICYNSDRTYKGIIGLDNLTPKDILRVIRHKLTDSAHCARIKGYMPCTATAEELLPTFTTVCQVCKIDVGDKIKLDHCHDTGVFRGWLCNGCNLSIGHAKNSIELLHKLIIYLKETRSAADQ